MKRYRVLSFNFDTRARILAMEIQSDWNSQIKEQWESNKREIREGLIQNYGTENYDGKIQNFMDLGVEPFSVIAFHNIFFRQARDAFVIGSYYPALTSACALGERILNQLMLHLRDYYKSSPEYKKVYRKDSFDNWDVAIDALESWGVLRPNATTCFRELKDIRNTSLHFDPEIDTNTKEIAKEAIGKLSGLINEQFSSFGKQPWFIPCKKGATFVRKDSESTPFVKEIILPNCFLVGHKHKLESKNGNWIVHDNHDYESIGPLSDEEFIKRFEEEN